MDRGGRDFGAGAENQETDWVAAWRDRRCGLSLDRIVRSTSHLAYAAAKRWTRDPARVEDLAQEGIIGIMRSLDRFDPQRGMAFRNHCWLAARSAVAEAAPSVLSLIDVPEAVWRAARRDDVESRERDLLAMQLWGMLSLDAPAGAGSMTVGDTIADGDADAHQRMEREDGRSDVRNRIETALAGLPAQDVLVFRRRRLQEEPDPVEKLARDLSMTREKVRKIEARTVHFVRTALMVGGYGTGAAA